ncbi:MBL fold metallo-hydrolase [Desulfofundulus thermocisternus]|uniref:MBL fold metallo-hydrolase n=1 Tax=Desulfofundulus thermocisternus TaxID=42471 RepID=UPI00217E6184|nr:MBL fold metallo-hydrolase [Desulfofundulus thermocisternus]MCS5697367.1 MBL fold metallo-hydrolase [Desulfofundulus thermocisternus]
MKKLAFDPFTVKYLIATHGHIDHTGGLAYLKEKLRAEVVAHELELPAVEGKNIVLTAASYYGVKYRPVAVDVVLRGEEETLDLGGLKLVLLHTPGHTPGGISPYVDLGGKRVLFGQDIHGPFHPPGAPIWPPGNNRYTGFWLLSRISSARDILGFINPMKRSGGTSKAACNATEKKCSSGQRIKWCATIFYIFLFYIFIHGRKSVVDVQ